jgi:hypothetical protein
LFFIFLAGARIQTVSRTKTCMAVALLAAGVIGGAGVGLATSRLAGASMPLISPPAISTSATAMAPDFSDIVARNGAAVINISVVGKLPRGRAPGADAQPDGPGVDPATLFAGISGGLVCRASNKASTTAHPASPRAAKAQASSSAPMA